jgi:hypothetical protein
MKLSFLSIFACSQTKVINLEDAVGSLRQTEAASKKQKRRVYMIRRFIAVLMICSVSDSFAQNDSLKGSDEYVRENTDSLSTKFNIPIFSTSGGEVENDLEQQDVSSLLTSSRDVFAQFASFQWGAGRYRMRGYLAENLLVMINGINVNNLETGFSSWSNWGGLNDVTRYVENRIGLVPSRLAFTGAGGYTNIDSKASSFKKATRVSYSYGNRIYAHRLMVTHSTGMLQNGWASTVSFSNRYGDQVYVPGTYFNASAFYFSLDKRVSDKHLLSFTGFGAPIETGRSSYATHEAYDLAGTHYYNDYWGYQNGKVRNAASAKTMRPMLMLSHEFRINTSSQLKTSVFYNFGRSGYTGFTWYNSVSVQPDYYRYMPSYFYQTADTLRGDQITNSWRNDPIQTGQIQWDNIIRVNQANLAGGSGNTTLSRSRYIIENKVEDLKREGFNIVYSKRSGELFISAGVNGTIQKTRKFKEVEDLLGGSYWLDVDYFTQGLGVSYVQNNINAPNREVKLGEKFGYDYSININRGEAWGQAEYTFSKLDAYVSLSLSNSKVWREGFVANGKFPTTSMGTSDISKFFNYGTKGGLIYKLDGRNFITVNAGYLTRMPEANGIFISPRTRNDLVKNVISENVLSTDINYMAKYPAFKFRATYYNTTIRDQIWLRTFWSDEFNNIVNYIMTGVDQNHQGIELGIEKTLFVAHTIQGAFGYGQFLYKGHPTAQAWQDNTSASLFQDRTVYLNNYRVGMSPQLVTGIGYRYNSKKFWFAGISFNYFDEIYIDPNPDRRTAEAISKYVATDPQLDRILNQERLPSYYTVNLNAGKSFRIMKKYFLNFNGSVNNLLNNKNIITHGYEQLRWDQSNIDKFPNKYQYMTGLTFMLQANFNF